MWVLLQSCRSLKEFRETIQSRLLCWKTCRPTCQRPSRGKEASDEELEECPRGLYKYISTYETIPALPTGTCVCQKEYKGTDCSLPASAAAGMRMLHSSPCDTRYTNCSFATIFGVNFVEEDTILKCVVSDTKVSMKFWPGLIRFNPRRLT